MCVISDRTPTCFSLQSYTPFNHGTTGPVMGHPSPAIQIWDNLVPPWNSSCIYVARSGPPDPPPPTVHCIRESAPVVDSSMLSISVLVTIALKSTRPLCTYWYRRALVLLVIVVPPAFVVITKIYDVVYVMRWSKYHWCRCCATDRRLDRRNVSTDHAHAVHSGFLSAVNFPPALCVLASFGQMWSSLCHSKSIPFISHHIAASSRWIQAFISLNSCLSSRLPNLLTSYIGYFTLSRLQFTLVNFPFRPYRVHHVVRVTWYSCSISLHGKNRVVVSGIGC